MPPRKRKGEGDTDSKVLVFRGSNDAPVAVPEEVVVEAERAFRAYTLKRAGKSWHEIALSQDYPNAAAAAADVQRYLAEGRALVMADSAMAMLDLEMARLDALQSAHWDKAIDGNLAAADFCRKVITDRVRILGLDQSTVRDDAAKVRTIVVYGNGEEYVAALQQAAGGDSGS